MKRQLKISSDTIFCSEGVRGGGDCGIHMATGSEKSNTSESDGIPHSRPVTHTVPAIKIASPMLDTGVFQFAALKGEMDMET
jgi:hypothetical protein